MSPWSWENVTAPWDYKLYSWSHFIPLLPDHKEVNNFIPIRFSPMTFCLTTIQKQWSRPLRPWSQITPSSFLICIHILILIKYRYANIHTCTFWSGQEYNNKIQNLFWAKSMSFWNLLGKHSEWLDRWQSSPRGKGTLSDREFLHQAWAYKPIMCPVVSPRGDLPLPSHKWSFAPCPSTIKMLNTWMWRNKYVKQNVKHKNWNANLNWNSFFVWTKEMLTLYKNRVNRILVCFLLLG